MTATAIGAPWSAFGPRTSRARASRGADWSAVSPAPRTQTAEPAPTDAALMERFCRGDEAAFEMLYERHAPAIFNFLQRMVREPALAEDVLQTTFLSVVRARGRYEPDSTVRAWIFAIAANAGRDALRRRRARREDPAPATADRELVAETPAPPDPAASRAVQDALMQLPVDQREAVVMHKLHDLSFAEIATALGITIGAAKVRAHRGYVRLRELLAPLGESI